MKPEIREPVVERDSIRAVVFVEDGTVDCRLSFLYGPASDYILIYLKMTDVPAAVHAYDAFNSLFKPRAFEMQGIRKISRVEYASGQRYIRSILEANWKISKEQFKNLLEDIRQNLGENWYTVFSRITIA